MTYSMEEWYTRIDNRLVVQEMVLRALDPLVDLFAKRPSDGQYSRYQIKRFNEYAQGSGKSTYARMRFDVDISHRLLDELTPRGEMIYVMETVAEDFADLVIYGDVHNTSDALLKSIDGGIKRGKHPKAVEVLGAEIHTQINKRRGKAEYTLFAVIAIDWEENGD